MDDSTVGTPHYRVDGFANQRLYVVPRPLVETALTQPVTRRLVVTDAGYYPAATGHRMHRDRGIVETVVLLCVEGRGSVQVGGSGITLVPGAAIVIPAGMAHRYFASETSPWTIWWMHVRGPEVSELITPLVSPTPHLVHLHSLDRIVSLFDEVVSTLSKRPTPVQLLAASGAAAHLLTRFAVDAALPAEGTPLERAMRHLEARVDARVSVAELAAVVQVSPSHLSALFRQATGNGPAAFHASLKMTRARLLLDTTRMTIAEVATAVGYADPLYFSRQFSRVHGVSPRAYRAQHKA
ncbi:AraC family transcriptional regulator [Microbacterium aquimaris]|uniref:AraC family transcriptional regulator n=1 Tax=Microbacterium aquimaris TaxID=459816 RepID=UPI002AD4EDFF|nr:AraC family transcriptional regulator [Microbacterium aquimaris]MDZ8275243.1 AraC family transcriptional regulator [Microbacterium aquimaris]